MIVRTRSACSAHQAALIDFADRRERTAGTLAALAHLERCRRCEDELAGYVRTISGLHRLADSVATIEPGVETWPRLRERVSRREARSRGWPQPLGGLMAAAVVALLVLPSLGGGALPAPAGPDQAPGLTFVDDRHYESPAGALTADMVNAIAGLDVSKQARLRSAAFHIGPSSVDRDEPSRGSTGRVGSSDGTGMPVAIARS
jgi:hypothetical protein